MGIDTFPPWVTKVRKDPLGFSSFNRLINRFRWTEDLFAKEHLLADYGSAKAGDHNAAEIPREVGSCYVTGGPTNNAEGFRYATVAYPWSSTGFIQMAFDSSVYSSVDQMVLLTQNCSEAGINKPCVTNIEDIGPTGAAFSSFQLTDALGGGNTWDVDDGHFCLAIHSAPLPTGAAATSASAKDKGDFVSDRADDWGAMVQNDADLRRKFITDGVGDSHDSTGFHLAREVAQTWADVYWDGVVYRVRDTSTRNACNTATQLGTGHVQLAFNSDWVLPAQPFVMVNGSSYWGYGAANDIWNCVTPRSLILTAPATIDLYLYRYVSASNWWVREDADFFLTVYSSF